MDKALLQTLAARRRVLEYHKEQERLENINNNKVLEKLIPLSATTYPSKLEIISFAIENREINEWVHRVFGAAPNEDWNDEHD